MTNYWQVVSQLSLVVSNVIDWLTLTFNLNQSEERPLIGQWKQLTTVAGIPSIPPTYQPTNWLPTTYPLKLSMSPPPSLSHCYFNWFKSLFSLLENYLNHEHHNKNLNNSILALPLPKHNWACFLEDLLSPWTDAGERRWSSWRSWSRKISSRPQPIWGET